MARFADLTDAELMQLLEDKLSDSLKKTIRYSVSVLSNYAISREGTFRDVNSVPILISHITKQIVTVIIDQ